MKKNGNRIIYEDPLLWISFLILTGLGIIMLYSASSHLSIKITGSSSLFFVKKQLVFAGIGAIAMLFFRFLPYEKLRSISPLLMIISIILLASIFLTPFGHKVGGASRWLRFPFFSFQPSTFALYSITIFFAHSMAKHEEKMSSFKSGILPYILIFIIFAAFLYNQPDFGTIVIMAAILWIMLISGGARIKHLILITMTGLGAGTLFMLREPYRLKRILSFFSPEKYASTISYQTSISLKSFINGGLNGTGLGKGILKLEYLPESHTDFIFSIIGEEFGFIGVFFIIALFTILFVRGFKIAEQAKDRFGTLLATGIISIIALHVIINICVTLSLLPPKGLPLPFISYGGTSLVMNMAGIGILMNIGASGK